jgi:hypothetical protein
VVTDTKGEVVYHADWVEVGSLFTLSDGGERFPANQLITIYSSNETTDQNNIIQSVQYHSSCSSNLFLKDRFGASQLVIWVNEDQGTDSCFANQTFELDITIPIDIVGGPATITSLTVASNIDPFFFNLTDKVFGIVADAGTTISTSLAIPIDLTTAKTYNLLVTVFAETQLGQICRATELTSFTAGYPLPPIFPTFSPTSAPTGTPAPTPDPETAACNLEADIDCRTSSGVSCRNLSPPTVTTCESDGPATSISFQYTAQPCGTTSNCEEANAGLPTAEGQVFVSIVGRNGVVGFSDIVVPDQIIRVSQGLTRDITVTISTVDLATGGPGTELQQVTGIRTECEGQLGRDLTLLTNYGAMRLVSFSNPEQGTQSILEELAVTYTVRNEGVLAATVTSAVRTVPGTVELLTDGEQLLSPDAVLRFEDTVTVNLSEQSGETVRFDLFAAGRGTVSSRECFDNERYSFVLG